MNVFILMYHEAEAFGYDYLYSGYVKAFKTLNEAITFAETIKEDEERIYLPDEKIQPDTNKFINTYYQINIEKL